MSHSHRLARIDQRPFLDRALSFGVDNGIIDRDRLRAIEEQGAKGIVQIASYFGTAHLRSDLELAMNRMVYLASLYLESISQGDLDRAARSLRDNTFLSHSRGGSDMLKALHALAASDFGGDSEHDVKDFLDQYTRKNQLSLPQYRSRYARHDELQFNMEAAVWLGTRMGLNENTVLEQDAESVIRTALLTRSTGTRTTPKMTGPMLTTQAFGDLLKTLRRKGAAASKDLFSARLTADVPAAYQDLVQDIQQEMVKRHLPKIFDASVPFNQLFDELSALYWRAPSGLQDISGLDTLVTDEWRKMTLDRTDDDSMNTVFLCVCAGLAPQPLITAAQAKAAVLTLRKKGIQAEAVVDFIRLNAPFEMADGLLAHWNDEFFPELKNFVLDAVDARLEHATAFLKDHCCIKAPNTRKSK